MPPWRTTTARTARRLPSTLKTVAVAAMLGPVPNLTEDDDEAAVDEAPGEAEA